MDRPKPLNICNTSLETSGDPGGLEWRSNRTIIIIINVKINVALSENASRTRYTIKIKLKLGKWVLEQKSFQLSFERREWAGERAEDCSTRTRLQLRMPGRRWCVLWFAVWWAFDGHQIVVAGVLPTHQSSANHWRDTEAPSYVDNGKLVQPVETECVQGPAAYDLSKQMCDMVVLPWL